MGGDKAAEGMAEEQYSRVKTSVWWDIENCQVPKGCDSGAIAKNISSALSHMNYCGPVSISAFGDTNCIPVRTQIALSSTGIALNHVPAGVKDASDKKILVDMLFWAVDNPAPANYLLISGDRDFSNALHQLSMRRYNILLAQPFQASSLLAAAAKSVWLWTNLSTGGPPMTPTELLKFSSSCDSSGRAPEFSQSCKSSGSESTTSEPKPAGSFAKPFVKNKDKSKGKLNRNDGKNSTSKSGIPSESPKAFKGKNSVHPVDGGASISGNSNPNKVKGNFNNSNMQHPRPDGPRSPMFRPPVPNVYQNQSFKDFRAGSQGSYINGNQGLEFTSESVNSSTYKNWEHQNQSSFDCGFILRALSVLKIEKIMPNEANIAACILHEDPRYNYMAVRMALDYCVRFGLLVEQTFGAVKLYVGRGEKLWECVNPAGNVCVYSNRKWKALQIYLSSPTGRAELLASQSRYEAAIIVRKGCFCKLTLGDVIQLLNMAIDTKKWIVTHQSGWQPIIINLEEAKDSADTSSEVKDSS